MTFAWPQLFWLLVLPVALLAWELSHRRRTAASARPKILRAEAGARSLKLSDFTASATTPNSRPRFWLCAGLVLAVVALARPQWGRLEEPVFDQSREIILAIDLSRSMLTPDVKPSRLERGKLLIQSLLEKMAGERVGLVVFAGTSFLQSPLSADYEILREFLPALGPEFLPEGGSNYGALLDTALQAFGASSAADRFLIILSDGEATDEEWKGKIDELKKKNIRVIGLGVGTAGGGMIPDGSGQFVKDERGAVVLSKLESGTLQQLAQATSGTYRDASTWVDLAALVKETIEAGRKGDFVEKNTVRLVERFQWPLALGLWCLFVSFCYEFPVRPRPRDVRLAPAGNRKPETGDRKLETSKVAASLVLLLLVSGLRFPVSGFAAASAGSPAAAAAASTPPEPSPLTKIVGRLASADTRTGRDWSELGRETATWGSKLQSEQQPVPEGPVRDALQAVDLGAKLDPKATDWPKLREELEGLLKKPDEDKKDQQNQDKSEQNDQQQDQDKKQQDQKSDQQKQDKSGNPQSSKDDQKDSSQKQDPNQKQDSKPPEQKPPGESAFGDMNKKDEPPPPPPPQSTQKVGGAPEKEPEKEPLDPSLALPMQKLDQLRNQDSPAQLFQLMEGDKKPVKKTGKDW
ncbi:VWA domain-containing protein [Horticoccus sp. 23ND18S-11]|uniref:VWA domain-containing protein n=1 Tax=Horticoccus sp. 23ND18S-11 TaxID=3391832 RepID=UPI0039C9A3D6